MTGAEVWLACGAALVGLFVGSGLHLVAIRLPLAMLHEAEAVERIVEAVRRRRPPDPETAFAQWQTRRLLAGPGHCTLCDRPVPLWTNLPLLSSLLWPGRCGQCGSDQPPVRLIMELAAALLPVLALAQLGPGWPALAATLFGWTALVIAVIDAQHFIIPDVLVFPLLAAGLAVNGFGLFVPAADAIFGAAVGLGIFYALEVVANRLAGRIAFGGGDTKFLGAMGAWCGVAAMGVGAALAAVLGAVAALALIAGAGPRRGEGLPFGTFLAVTATAMLLAGDAVMRGWMALFGPLSRALSRAFLGV